jgi:hypothetical protein
MPMSEYYDLMVLTQNSDNSLTGTFDFFTNNDNSLLPISKVKNDSVFFDFQNPDTIFTFRGTINRDFNSMSGYCNVRLLLVDPAHNIFYGTWGANKK